MSKVSETLKQRGSRYGTLEGNSIIIQKTLDIFRDEGQYDSLPDAHKEAIHMIVHKLSRMVSPGADYMYADNPHDIAGYATLLEEYILSNGGDLEK